jgi:hypothetical protein
VVYVLCIGRTTRMASSHVPVCTTYYTQPPKGMVVGGCTMLCVSTRWVLQHEQDTAATNTVAPTMHKHSM